MLNGSPVKYVLKIIQQYLWQKPIKEREKKYHMQLEQFSSTETSIQVSHEQEQDLHIQLKVADVYEFTFSK